MRSPDRRLPVLFSLAVVSCLVVRPPAVRAGEDWGPELLPRDEEVAAALEAAPAALRDQAGVYVLTAAGYDLVRASRNGFHCLLERSHPGAFEPQCFDAEGAETLLPQLLLAAKLRMGGAGDAEIRRAVADAWARGELRAPRRAGINYMLSPRNRVPVDEEGTIIPYRPHVMFYAPYLTNADVGGAPGGPSPVFVINEGRPGAYIIVPVPHGAPPPAPSSSWTSSTCAPPPAAPPAPTAASPPTSTATAGPTSASSTRTRPTCGCS